MPEFRQRVKNPSKPVVFHTIQGLNHDQKTGNIALTVGGYTPHRFNKPDRTKMKNSTKYKQEFALLSGAAAGVILTRTREPHRVINALKELAFEKESLFYQWNFRDGWIMPPLSPDGRNVVEKILDPYAALKRVRDIDGDGSKAWEDAICVMVWCEKLIGQVPPFDECLRQYSRDFNVLSTRLVIISPEGFIMPPHLQHDIPVLDFDLPNAEELRDSYDIIIESAANGGDIEQPFEEDDIKSLLSLGGGMTEAEFELSLAKAVAKNRACGWPNIPVQRVASIISDSKTEIVKRSEVLELMKPVRTDDIGGLELLKEWIKKRKSAFSDEAREFGVDAPKGIVLIGPPGCQPGDTRLLYRKGKRNSGRSISLAKLFCKFNGLNAGVRPWEKDQPVFLHSFDADSGRVFWNEVKDVIYAGSKQVIKVTTRQGRSTKLTANHPVLTNNGFVPAGNLQVGDVLIVKGSMLPNPSPIRYGRKPRQTIYGLRYYSGGCAKSYVSPASGETTIYKTQRKARLVIEAHMNGLTYREYVRQLMTNPEAINLKVLESEYVVHHIDENPMNDELSNLMVMSKEEHDRLHSDETNFNVEYTDIDAVVSIVPCGEAATYDIQMASPCHNYCTANGLIVHNTGKSMGAKAISSEFGIPLIRFDVSRVFGSLVGQSEGRVRSALKQLEAMAPCIAFLDEVDKAGIDPRQAGGDSGTSKRVMGSILTFMQETTAPVFWILTANRPTSLPPELLRKGRLDEVFSVLPPNKVEREEIIKIHLRKRHQKMIKGESLNTLLDQSAGYVGAEIEAAIKEAVVDAFNNGGKPVTGEDISKQLACMKPISIAFKEDFDEMATWASNNARPSSLNTETTKSLPRTVVRRGRIIN